MRHLLTILIKFNSQGQKAKIEHKKNERDRVRERVRERSETKEKCEIDKISNMYGFRFNAILFSCAVCWAFILINDRMMPTDSAAAAAATTRMRVNQMRTRAKIVFHDYYYYD